MNGGNKMQLIINARREGYDTDQCLYTMKVGELIDMLRQFDENTPVYLSHDNGYTFGSITRSDFEERDESEAEE